MIIVRKKIEIEYSLLVKVIEGIATENEIIEFNNWFNSSSKCEAYFKKLKRTYDKQGDFSKNDAIVLWDNIKRRTFNKRDYWIRAAIQYAALFILPLIIGAVYYHLFNTFNHEVGDAIVFPSNNEVQVVLFDGLTVPVNELKDIPNSKQNGIVLGDNISYRKIDADSLIFNTIKTPYGANYKFMLSDSSVVYLNSGSELRFPVNFIEENREVFLKGEAFFEVAHNQDQPFIVNALNSSIRVYGTKFNVMSYPDDDDEKITLAQGVIGVEKEGYSVILEPGEQAVCNKEAPIIVNEVETHLYISWKDGVFRFVDMPLSELAKKLSRMYDVSFYFEDSSVAQKRFTGKVDRTTDFEYFLGIIEKTTNVKIEINKRNLLISII